MLRSICLFSAALFPLAASAAVTFNIDAQILRDQSGNPLTSGVVIFAASLTDDTFGAPTPDAFVTGDDIILRKWAWDSGSEAGEFQKGGPDGLVFNFNDYSGLGPDDYLQLYWYPTRSFSDTAPGEGTPYGSFRSDIPEFLGTSAWRVPADGSIVSLAFLTQEAGGTRAATEGDASSFTPVPEPSFYAGAFAVSCLAWAVVSKKIRRREVV